MTQLLRADYKRVFKDKLFLVVCILGAAFAAVTPLLYVAIFGAAGEIDAMTKEVLMGYVTAKGQFFSSFSFGNNVGLIAPLLIGVILWKDFGSGTVRNKIISGHSRASIFSSMFTVCFTALFGVILAHALLTLGISLVFFEYQPTPFKIGDLWYFLISLLFEMLVYVFAAAFVSWLCATMKNVGMVIVMYIAVVFGCTMIAGILQGVILVLGMETGHENIIDVLNFIQRINIFNSSANIGLGTSYESKDVWYYVLPPILGTAALLTHGTLKFRRKDLK